MIAEAGGPRQVLKLLIVVPIDQFGQQLRA